MADTLIETMTSNPYEGIVADTTSQIADLDAQIEQVSSAITKLEKVSPTSPTLSSLRERLASLQTRKNWLTDQNNSAKTLMSSYNNSVKNVSTLAGIYELKEDQLNYDRMKAENEYNKMEQENRRVWQNYINALWNATSSENAIVNANAARQWASSQSTAEVRARNYLNNAQVQNEAANQTIQNTNAIREWKINTNAWYAQLSQSNADNTLRQQVMNDFEASEAQKDRDLQERLTNKQLAASKSSNVITNNTLDPSKLTVEEWQSLIKYYNEHKNNNEDEEENK